MINEEELFKKLIELNVLQFQIDELEAKEEVRKYYRAHRQPHPDLSALLNNYFEKQQKVNDSLQYFEVSYDDEYRQYHHLLIKEALRKGEPDD